jgi:hypothetical protein
MSFRGKLTLGNCTTLLEWRQLLAESMSRPDISSGVTMLAAIFAASSNRRAFEL